MYNVFPFDNTITTMFLSGHEIYSMLDFVASRSSERGCKTQAQVSGLWMVADCGATREVLDANRNPVIDPTTNMPARESFPIACGPFDASGMPAAHCNPDHRELDGPFLLGDGCKTDPAKCQPVVPSGEYRVAVNDYIASGGSGFAVLKRNTTKFNTGISLRDSLVDYLAQGTSRCDPTKWTNILGVNCSDVNGGRYDCTQGCACTCRAPAGQCPTPTKPAQCLEPVSTVMLAPGAVNGDTDCQAFNTCAGVCGCYDCNDHLIPGKTDCPEYKACVLAQPKNVNPAVYNYSTLPCLDPTGGDSAAEPHDGRISAVGGS
jgi:hypothetical protein